jgi:hypothetical protein
VKQSTLSITGDLRGVHLDTTPHYAPMGFGSQLKGVSTEDRMDWNGLKTRADLEALLRGGWLEW